MALKPEWERRFDEWAVNSVNFRPVEEGLTPKARRIVENARIARERAISENPEDNLHLIEATPKIIERQREKWRLVQAAIKNGWTYSELADALWEIGEYVPINVGSRKEEE